jgi:hypothetical protein
MQVYKVIRRYDRRAHHVLLFEKLERRDLIRYRELHPRRKPGDTTDYNPDYIDPPGLYRSWNRWMLKYRGRPDLRESNFSFRALTHIILADADLGGASFVSTTLYDADLNRADLGGTGFNGAKIVQCVLDGADLNGANLTGADIQQTSVVGVNLSDANLIGASLTDCDLTDANLSNCNIYGVSAWDLNLTGAVQSNLVITPPGEPAITLVITPPGEPAITVDNLEVAQFVYLLLKSEKLRAVLDTLTSKVVLILGRFTVERKAVLDAIRENLRSHGYLPVLFDFEKPASRDLTETITTLAHLSRFIIADLTDPKSVPHELASIIPTLAVPVQPIITATSRPYAMFEDFQRKYRWVLETYYYQDLETLLADLTDKVIAPAEQRFSELAGR